MTFSELPVWGAEVSLGAKVLYALERAEPTLMGEVLRERLQEALGAVQGSLGAYEAELVGAGF